MQNPKMTEVRKSYLDKLVDFFKKNTGFATLFYIVKAEVTKILAKHGILKEDIVEDVANGVMESLDFQEFIKNYNTNQGVKIRVFRLGDFIKKWALTKDDPLGYAEQVRKYFIDLTQGQWSMKDNFFPEDILCQLSGIFRFRHQSVVPGDGKHSLSVITVFLKEVMKEMISDDLTFRDNQAYEKGSWQELSTHVHPAHLFYNIRTVESWLEWYKDIAFAHGLDKSEVTGMVLAVQDEIFSRYGEMTHVGQTEFKDICKHVAEVRNSKVTDLAGGIEKPLEMVLMPTIHPEVFWDYASDRGESEREARVTDYENALQGIHKRFEEMLKEEASENVSGHDGE